MEIVAAGNTNKTQIIGPNTTGVATPGECFVGSMPAFNKEIMTEGEVGVISRSGSLGTLISLNITRAGLGQSAFIGIGGDPVIGTTTLEALKCLDEDERTKAIFILGEIGGNMEEVAAEYAGTMKKPVVAFIAGGAAPEGKKMGHAGAIVSGNKGTYESKTPRFDAGWGPHNRYPIRCRFCNVRCFKIFIGTYLKFCLFPHVNWELRPKPEAKYFVKTKTEKLH